MPNCFKLIRKATGEAEKLSTVDEEICALFNVPVHPTKWCNNWFNTIGFAIATGKTFQQIREDRLERLSRDDNAEKEIEWDTYDLKILDYLEANYTTDAWVQIGK